MALPVGLGLGYVLFSSKKKAGSWGNLLLAEKQKVLSVIDSNKSPAFLRALAQSLEKRGATVPAALATAKANSIASSGVGTTTTIAPGSMPQIQQGSTGAAVMAWQKIIGAASDGQFGPETLAKTRIWQANNGLSADGVVGIQSWSKAKALGLY